MTANKRSWNILTGARPLALTVMGAALLVSVSASARDWYVDGTRGGGGSGSYSDPYGAFWQAQQNAWGGDTIYLKPTMTYSSIYITKSGYNGRPITIAGMGGSSNMTKISGFGNGFAVWIGANYVTVTNLDITAPGLWSGLHIQDNQNHDVITNNRVHDAGGDGIDLVGDDYMTISYNTVYGNAKNTWNNEYGSGISIKGSKDIDGNTGKKMFVTGNKTYANTNTCYHSGCADSDGSGIIIDNNRRTYSDYNAYRGGTLISNNVSYGNGGRGIHMYLSDNITVNGNTCYHNNQDGNEGNASPGEIEGNNVGGITAINNILYSDGQYGRYTGQHVPISMEYNYKGGGIVIQHNLGYATQYGSGKFLVSMGNSISVSSYDNYWGDPAFVNATLDSRYADFRVKNWSPAMYHGLNYTGVGNDITGAGRYTPTTIGAYEKAAY